MKTGNYDDWSRSMALQRGKLWLVDFQADLFGNVANGGSITCQVSEGRPHGLLKKTDYSTKRCRQSVRNGHALLIISLVVPTSR
jgi:hypothetical protein